MTAPLFQAHVLTLFPEMFPGPLGVSLSGKALAEGTWTLSAHDIRAHAHDKHRSVDDTPTGGGPGMVMRPDVLASALDATATGSTLPRIYLSPRGRRFDQAMAKSWVAAGGVVIVCGRFEGIDQRVIDSRGLEEVSIGDYILSGGEPAALVLLDAIVRVLPGVMGNPESGTHESFENDLLEHPHYTRPQVFEGVEIPGVLTSGNHAAIDRWRHEEAVKLTSERRPDLLGLPSAQPVTK